MTFNVVGDPASTLTVADHQTRYEFQLKSLELARKVNAAIDVANQNSTKLDQMKRALDLTPNAPKTLRNEAVAYQNRVKAVLNALQGDFTLGSKSDPTPVSIAGRIFGVGGSYSQFLGRPTGLMEEQYAITAELFGAELARLKQLVQTDIPALEKELEKAGAPYTTGRIPGPP